MPKEQDTNAGIGALAFMNADQNLLDSMMLAYVLPHPHTGHLLCLELQSHPLLAKQFAKIDPNYTYTM